MNPSCCAIEMERGCIIVCEGAGVSMTIKKLAQERGCTVITTPYDTYTAARLINQSMPISYFMTRENLITFGTRRFHRRYQGCDGQQASPGFPDSG